MSLVDILLERAMPMRGNNTTNDNTTNKHITNIHSNYTLSKPGDTTTTNNNDKKHNNNNNSNNIVLYTDYLTKQSDYYNQLLTNLSNLKVKCCKPEDSLLLSHTNTNTGTTSDKHKHINNSNNNNNNNNKHNNNNDKHNSRITITSSIIITGHTPKELLSYLPHIQLTYTLHKYIITYCIHHYINIQHIHTLLTIWIDTFMPLPICYYNVLYKYNYSIQYAKSHGFISSEEMSTYLINIKDLITLYILIHITPYLLSLTPPENKMFSSENQQMNIPHNYDPSTNAYNNDTNNNNNKNTSGNSIINDMYNITCRLQSIPLYIHPNHAASTTFTSTTTTLTSTTTTNISYTIPGTGGTFIWCPETVLEKIMTYSVYIDIDMVLCALYASIHYKSKEEDNSTYKECIKYLLDFSPVDAEYQELSDYLATQITINRSEKSGSEHESGHIHVHHTGNNNNNNNNNSHNVYREEKEEDDEYNNSDSSSNNNNNIIRLEHILIGFKERLSIPLRYHSYLPLLLSNLTSLSNRLITSSLQHDISVEILLFLSTYISPILLLRHIYDDIYTTHTNTHTNTHTIDNTYTNTYSSTTIEQVKMLVVFNILNDLKCIVTENKPNLRGILTCNNDNNKNNYTGKDVTLSGVECADATDDKDISLSMSQLQSMLHHILHTSTQPQSSSHNSDSISISNKSNSSKHIHDDDVDGYSADKHKLHSINQTLFYYLNTYITHLYKHNTLYTISQSDLVSLFSSWFSLLTWLVCTHPTSTTNTTTSNNNTTTTTTTASISQHAPTTGQLSYTHLWHEIFVTHNETTTNSTTNTTSNNNSSNMRNTSLSIYSIIFFELISKIPVIRTTVVYILLQYKRYDEALSILMTYTTLPHLPLYTTTSTSTTATSTTTAATATAYTSCMNILYSDHAHSGDSHELTINDVYMLEIIYLIQLLYHYISIIQSSLHHQLASHQNYDLVDQDNINLTTATAALTASDDVDVVIVKSIASAVYALNMLTRHILHINTTTGTTTDDATEGVVGKGDINNSTAVMVRAKLSHILTALVKEIGSHN